MGDRKQECLEQTALALTWTSTYTDASGIYGDGTCTGPHTKILRTVARLLVSETITTMDVVPAVFATAVWVQGGMGRQWNVNLIQCDNHATFTTCELQYGHKHQCKAVHFLRGSAFIAEDLVSTYAQGVHIAETAKAIAYVLSLNHDSNTRGPRKSYSSKFSCAS